MAQATVWRITIETNRDWSGVMLPPHKRMRHTLHHEANPFAPEHLVVATVAERHVRPKMDRILKVEKWKEVVL